MKNKKNNAVLKIFIIGGIALLVCAAIVLGVWQYGIYDSDKKNTSYVTTLRELIPDPQGAALEDRRDNTMATLSVDDTDFLGIIEMPLYDCSLPVGAEWGESSKRPCRFSGSVYDGSLIIGATSQKGQYDFYREISVGDTLLFTDVEGNLYTYTVADLRYENNADRKTLLKTDADLTLFIKNIYDFEYLIVYCNAKV